MTRTPPPHRCSIGLWRGYVSAQFYAHDGNGSGSLAFSPAFRTWRLPWQPGMPLRDDPRALAALEALEGDLRSTGWERMRRAPGSEWYERRFRREPAAVDPLRRASLTAAPHS